MIPKHTLRAIVGVLACALCGAAAAQMRDAPHERGGGAPGGFGMERGAPMGHDRGEPGIGRGYYERGVPVLDRRGEGGPPEGYPAYPRAYAPAPRYGSPPPRRYYEAPPDAPPGWRAANRPPPGIERARPPPGMQGPPMASLGFVIESIQRRSPGRQLDSNVDYLDGRPVYRVRWLTEHGRRTDYIVDAQTGVILSGR